MVLSRIQYFPPGTVYLEEKAIPSQDSSTSDVSVGADVKDLPLLGNRKFWPSLLFHPTETSPSDMGVDAARSFKKTVGWNEVIQSHTCHSSSEASI